jgi:hypothetical protein
VKAVEAELEAIRSQNEAAAQATRAAGATPPLMAPEVPVRRAVPPKEP